MATRTRVWCVLILFAYPFFSIGMGVTIAVFGTSPTLCAPEPRLYPGLACIRNYAYTHAHAVYSNP